MQIDNLITIIILFILRKTLDGSPEGLQWKKYANYGIGLSFLLMMLSSIGIGFDIIWAILTALLFGVIAFVIYIEPRFEHKKFLINSWGAYVIASFLSAIVAALFPSFFASWESTFKLAQGFALLWGAGIWFFGKKERKIIEKERLIAIEKEKEYEITQQIRASLEKDIADRTQDLIHQKETLQKTVENLKATQKQLIHAEKMASLGELTAGIAHEIQNPLNFVNNFSEVSNELIEEILEEYEKKKGEVDQSLVKENLEDLKNNLEKITVHGKRADGIVKGMLQHSRSSSGKKEKTDLNQLVDEYLRLSYHGLKAKDKSFNAEFTSDLDPNVPMLDLIPQDIGRVVLNLINNAFYAVNEKRLSLQKEGEKEVYKPKVTVSTKKSGKKVIVKIQDNGKGMPDEVKEKVFQPFFTTKPTGEGTGLGLSLSYDIIKAHGGDIKVESSPNKGTSLIIELFT